MNYSIKPEEHELRQAKQVVQEALETCKTVEEKDRDFEVSLGWMAIPRNVEAEGASGGSGDEEFIFLEFNTSAENWKEDLKHVTAYSYGRSLFLELVDYQMSFGWQELLIEAFALQFLEKAYEGAAERDLEWSREELEETWPEVKESLDEEAVWFEADDPIWDAAYSIGKELTEEHDLKDLSDRTRSDLIEIGDKLFT